MLLRVFTIYVKHYVIPSPVFAETGQNINPYFLAKSDNTSFGSTLCSFKSTLFASKTAFEFYF